MGNKVFDVDIEICWQSACIILLPSLHFGHRGATMASLTIRNLPDDLIERLKETAFRHGRSMEQELRLLLQSRYTKRSELLDRVRGQWDDAVAPKPGEVDRWRQTGRK